jgi:hypothetical protein
MFRKLDLLLVEGPVMVSSLFVVYLTKIFLNYLEYVA